MVCRKNTLFASNRMENTVTTGGAGFAFESRIGAYFLAQMCLNGLIPGVPDNYRIVKIIFQSGSFKTDDIVVHLECGDGKPEIKILCQLKLGMSATISSPIFKETIIDAWADYNNEAFYSGLDRFFFITGLFNQADNHIIQILDDLHSDNSNGRGFWEKYNSTINSYSKKAKEKFEKIISYITEANSGNRPTQEEIFNFLSAFRIIRSDLHVDATSIGGLNLSLIQNQLKGFFNGYRFTKSPQDIWNGLNIYCNSHKNGIPITREDFSSEELANLLKVERVIEQPDEYKNIQIPHLVPITNFRLDIIKLNLIGSWDENYTGDKQIVADVLNVSSYEEANEKIQNILNFYPNLLNFSQGRYVIKEREQVLKETSKYLTNDMIRKLEPLFEKILSEQDPLIDLSIEEIIESNMRGIKPNYSPSIHTGIANTLAMLSNNTSIIIHASETASNTPLSIMRKLINEDTDWKTCLSISKLFPVFAEIDPVVYLGCIEGFIDKQIIHSDDNKKSKIHSLRESPAVIDDIITSLEVTAWREDTLLTSCDILIKIATVIDTDLYSNKISDVIIQILLPWRPCTLSPVQSRFYVVNLLLGVNPQIGWWVLLGLLPNKTQFSTGIRKPYWQKNLSDGCKSAKITYDEFYKQSQYYLSLSFSEMKKIPSRVLDIIFYIQLYHEETYTSGVLEYLSSDEASSLPDEIKQKIISELHKILLYNNRKNEDNKFSKEIISKLQKVIKNLCFDDKLSEALLLFDTDDWLLIDSFEISSTAEGEEQLQKQREDMIEKVLSLPEGYKNIEKLALKMNPQHIRAIGVALSSVDNKDIINKLFPKLLDRSNHLSSIAAGFAWKKFFTDDISWFDRFDFSLWSKEQKITLLTSLPSKRKTWDYIPKLLEDDIDYWSNLPIGCQYQIDDEVKDYEYAIKKFSSIGRNATAIDCIDICLFKKMSPDIKICLNALESNNCKESFSRISDYTINNIFSYLRNQLRTTEQKLQELEWKYLHIYKNSFKPQAIINAIKTDPSLFIEIIRTIYKSTNKNYQKTKLADVDPMILYSLLHKYEIIPGLSKKGLDEKQFENWINKVLSETKRSGHLQNALYVIGEILSKRPPSEKGLYIDERIAKLLNVAKNKRMRDGYYIGTVNSEGIRTVDPTGKSELEKSILWRQRAKDMEALGLRYFAETLNSISRSHTYQAERDKKRGELDDYLDYQLI